MNFGNNLKRLRKEQNLTQAQVADIIGVSLRTYTSWELYNKIPRQEITRRKIEELFNIPFCDILSSSMYSEKSCEEVMTELCARLFSGSESISTIRNCKQIFIDAEQEYKDKLINW